MTTIPTAQMIDNHILKVQIPSGKKVGDTFFVKPTHGSPIMVTVPLGMNAGEYIDIVLANEPASSSVNSAKSDTDGTITVNKTIAGAAIAGAVLGSCLFGPIIGICLGAGSAYAASKEPGQVGEVARSVGKKTYKVCAKASTWASNQLDKHTQS